MKKRWENEEELMKERWQQERIEFEKKWKETEAKATKHIHIKCKEKIKTYNDYFGNDDSDSE